jgi:hypothetical protein
MFIYSIMHSMKSSNLKPHQKRLIERVYEGV